MATEKQLLEFEVWARQLMRTGTFKPKPMRSTSADESPAVVGDPTTEGPRAGAGGVPGNINHKEPGVKRKKRCVFGGPPPACDCGFKPSPTRGWIRRDTSLRCPQCSKTVYNHI